ncbi:hypothetical protein EYF80_043565 [Liparis tanakae]|uniref:Uncharacterized protein n=1 Tax=Liparis tanakae TaxID=230148 RepID=A0A4Z2G157_9TELE|nr:hypothetical protein EYF80_043565 [Liparis tanakae]
MERGDDVISRPSLELLHRQGAHTKARRRRRGLRKHFCPKPLTVVDSVGAKKLKKEKLRERERVTFGPVAKPPSTAARGHRYPDRVVTAGGPVPSDRPAAACVCSPASIYDQGESNSCSPWGHISIKAAS